ncbi:hypothetical protein Cylst_4835 [Cylindrospermum stagnale PCC 7417]|uniref:Uncharacterized protein n=1 Tax=Cylindrospermum stagnale PCC 7417 TaxID=56107 RepID=K9X4A6_9NOST|nr:hypothetical protein [Cylindrospermum stagnale]AFZ26891.1 hypothetical protein Cylst_4835 [Cylindrospermum stagnale PCC 7417]
MSDNDWTQQKTTIAIANDDIGEWHFLTFPSWDEARQAINAARSEGKAAVFYDGATLPVPPELPLPPELPKD